MRQQAVAGPQCRRGSRGFFNHPAVRRPQVSRVLRASTMISKRLGSRFDIFSVGPDLARAGEEQTLTPRAEQVLLRASDLAATRFIELSMPLGRSHQRPRTLGGHLVHPAIGDVVRGRPITSASTCRVGQSGGGAALLRNIGMRSATRAAVQTPSLPRHSAIP